MWLYIVKDLAPARTVASKKGDLRTLGPIDRIGEKVLLVIAFTSVNHVVAPGPLEPSFKAILSSTMAATLAAWCHANLRNKSSRHATVLLT